MDLRRALIAFLLLAVTAPADARAQIPLLDKVFGNVTDLSVFVATGNVTDERLTVGEPGDERNSWGLRGIGVEVLIPLGSITKTDSASHPETEWTREPASVTVRTNAGGTEVHRDSTITITKKETPAQAETVALFEIALGYSRMTRFRGFPGDSIDIRGSFEDLPSVTFYLTWWPFALDLGIYGGVRLGLSQFRGLRAVLDSLYVLPGTADTLASGTLVTGGGTALHLGWASGLVVPLSKRVDLFGEATYTWRKFRSVEWNAVGGRIPHSLPRSLDLGGLTLAVGVQVRIRDQQ